MDAKVINQHDALAPTSVLGYLLKEVAVGKLVDGLVDNMDSDNHTIHIDGGGDSNRLELLSIYLKKLINYSVLKALINVSHLKLRTLIKLFKLN